MAEGDPIRIIPYRGVDDDCGSLGFTVATISGGSDQRAFKAQPPFIPLCVHWQGQVVFDLDHVINIEQSTHSMRIAPSYTSGAAMC
jgi:hypothetical protein